MLINITPVDRLLRCRGDLVIAGEPVGIHLAVTPSWGPHGWSGQWTVTHAASGAGVGHVHLCLDHARSFGRALAESDMDWDRPIAALLADATLPRRLAAVLTSVLGSQACQGCPRWTC